MRVSSFQAAQLARSIRSRSDPEFLPCFVDWLICVVNVVLFFIAAMILR